MNYANSTLQQAHDSASLNAIGSPGELNRLTDRLVGVRSGLQEITANLLAHADRLHGNGSIGNAQGAEKPRPARSGVLGNLEDLIDSIEEQVVSLNAAAYRNTILA